MFRPLQFWWATKRSSLVLGAVIFVVFALFAFFVIAPKSQPLPGAIVHGVVISAGPTPDVGFCPDPHQIAAVRLSNGRVVHAQVASAKTLPPGALVSLRQWRTACNPNGYEVVLHEQSGT